MTTKTTKFIDFLKKNNWSDLFEARPTDEGYIFLHTEKQIEARLVIDDDSSRTDIYYIIAHCPNALKYEQILTLLNQLNEEGVLKFFLAENGRIVAQITYWAKDEFFDPEFLLSLYLSFYGFLEEDHIVEQVMKIIWR